MKVLYIECNMGIAGDMLLSSLLDLTEDKEKTMDELNQIGISDVTYQLERKESCGVYGTHIRVLVGDQEEESVDAHYHTHDHHHDDDHHHSHHHHDDDHHRTHDHHHDDNHHHTHDHHHDHHHDDDHHHTHHHHDDNHHHTHHHHGEGHHTHTHTHTHTHAGMEEITQIIDSLQVSDAVKQDAKAVYQRIAEAESQVHGKDVAKIHFHEVGSKDAIADIVGCAYMMEKLGPDQIIFSPITTGYGRVRCAHGILPVPAPATALLLRGIPSCAGHEEGELATPTGVALAGHFAKEFSQRPLMTIKKIGYGMGNKEYAAANCVRAFLGEV